MPLAVAIECRLASYLHLDPVRVRRLPLALALLWCNSACQADGLETWWLTGDGIERVSDEAVDEKIAKARAADNHEDFSDDDYDL